jgi:hypothetical protein
VPEVFASRPWYRERPEPEEELEGLLLAAPPAALGPASRGTVGFILQTPGADHPVYSAGMDDVLRSLGGRRVRVRAKLVDLSSEGFGVELWVARVEEPRASESGGQGTK